MPTASPGGRAGTPARCTRRGLCSGEREEPRRNKAWFWSINSIPNEAFYTAELLPSRQRSKEPPDLAEWRIKANARCSSKTPWVEIFFSPHAEGFSQHPTRSPTTPDPTPTQDTSTWIAEKGQESGCMSCKSTSLDRHLHAAFKKQVWESNSRAVEQQSPKTEQRFSTFLPRGLQIILARSTRNNLPLSTASASLGAAGTSRLSSVSVL